MVTLGIYRHYKGGEYKVIGVATHTETDEELVIYVDVHGKLWARPESMFTDWVGGKLRFQLVTPR